MNHPNPLADSSVPTNGLSVARRGVRRSQAIAGTLAALFIAAACVAPAAAAKPLPDNSSGYQDLRNPDTRDVAEGRFPQEDGERGDGADLSGVAIAGAGAGALVVGLSGLSRRRRSARRPSGAAA